MANAESFNRKFLPRTHILQVVLRWLSDRARTSRAFSLRSRLSILLAGFLTLGFLTLGSLIAFPSASFADAVTNTAPEKVIVPSDEAISDENKEHFAQAYVEVLKLLSDREPELSAANSAEAPSIQDSIEADAVAIIENNGLTMPEYMQILGIASQDEALRNEVLSDIDTALQE